MDKSFSFFQLTSGEPEKRFLELARRTYEKSKTQTEFILVYFQVKGIPCQVLVIGEEDGRLCG